MSMTPKEATEKLEQMQAQVIHGSNLFGDIADLVRKLELAALAGQDPMAPLPELKGTFPLVLYFDTDKDRNDFARMFQRFNPNLKARSLE